MTADLSAGVRDAAAQELYLLETRRGRDGWTFAAPSTVDKYRARVDAVVSVVAPQIARPLQARIEELEDLLKALVDDFDNGTSSPQECRAHWADARAQQNQGGRRW